MIALKLLAKDRVAPYTGFVWQPGQWVEARDYEHGIYAVDGARLPLWFEDELWRIELAGDVRSDDLQLCALRARLLERVEPWSATLHAQYCMDMALRARDWAVESLRRDGRAVEAEALAACKTLPEIRDVATPLSADATVRDSSNQCGYARDAANRGAQVNVGATAHIVRCARVLYDGGDELPWQAAYLAGRLGI